MEGRRGSFCEGITFQLSGRRELGESKRLSCIPNMLRQVLPVSIKPRTKELEKKNLKQEDRVWRKKCTLVSM